MHADPKSAKKTDNLTVFFVLLGFAHIKAARKILVKLTTGLQTQAVSTQSSAKYFCTKTACQILVKLTPGV